MSWSAGFRRLAVPDPPGVDVPVMLFHPATAPESPHLLGPWPAELAVDVPLAPLPPGSTPLVLLSHGTGSTPALHRALAAHLARHGLVVAALEHPGNRRGDDALAGTARILADRPRHVRRVADHLLGPTDSDTEPDTELAAPTDNTAGPAPPADPADSSLPSGGTDELRTALRRDRYGVVGHSLGGATALTVAGGRPGAAAHETPDGVPAAVPVEHDPRVGAVVLLSPATPWFLAEGALRDVRVPVLIHTGGRDPHTPPWHARLVVDGVADPDLVELHVQPDAGHFSFTSPVPTEMVDPARPPTVDPPGFDRAAAAPALQDSVLAFLRRALSPDR